MSPVHTILRDLLGALLDHGPQPDTQVGGRDVCKSKTCNAFELMNVELKRSNQKIIKRPFRKEKPIFAVSISTLSIFFLFLLFFFFFKF